jgi:AcrR family transcriptional regulator
MCPRARKKGPVTRDLILDSAIAAFARHGLDASFQRIASDCGLSQGAIFHHFPDRESLIDGVLQKIVARNHQTVSASVRVTDSAPERLMKHFRGNLEWGLSYPEEAQILLLVYYLACVGPHFSALYAQMLANARNRILEHVHAGVREGAFDPAIDARVAAEVLHDALVGCFVNALSGSGRAAGEAGGQVSLRRLTAKWELLVAKLLQRAG